MSTFGILFFLLLGGLVFFALARVISFTRSRKTEKRFLAMLYLAVLLIGFGLAWAYTSFLESEPYAAYMGLVVFGGLGLILGGLGMWKVTGSQTEPPGQLNDENKSDLSWQKGAAIVLVLMFTLTLPMAWLLKSVTRVVSDRDRASTFLFESLLSDRALPDVVRKALEYEAWLTRMDDPVGSVHATKESITPTSHGRTTHAPPMILPRTLGAIAVAISAAALKTTMNETPYTPSTGAQPANPVSIWP